MLVSSALVLMMTGPGLALFYGGLVRRKNVLTTMMQSFVMMAVITVIWALFGYSLAFAKGNAFIGGFDYLFMHGVGGDTSVYAATIPHQTFMIYQLMFAIITPALITGAFAERMKFNGMLVFCTLWTIVVYFPLAHMVWGEGGLLNATAGLGGKFPVLDFAGGTVVHISSGCSALVCALYLGKRAGYPKMPFMPHNLVLSVIGACMLWVGWFGFNAGSALGSNAIATNAFVTTHFAAAAAAIAWLVIEWLRLGKPTCVGRHFRCGRGTGRRPVRTALHGGGHRGAPSAARVRPVGRVGTPGGRGRQPRRSTPRCSGGLPTPESAASSHLVVPTP